MSNKPEPTRREIVDRVAELETQLAEADQVLANLKTMVDPRTLSLWTRPVVDKATARHAERVKARAESAK
jgi:uncharacterized coiled-coil protein SlyX